MNYWDVILRIAKQPVIILFFRFLLTSPPAVFWKPEQVF